MEKYASKQVAGLVGYIVAVVFSTHILCFDGPAHSFLPVAHLSVSACRLERKTEIHIDITLVDARCIQKNGGASQAARRFRHEKTGAEIHNVGK